MDGSSTRWLTGCSSGRERPSGFFIRGLGPSVLGRAWYEGVLAGAEPPESPQAQVWLHPKLIEPAFATLVRASFHSETPIPHVCLEDPLLPLQAEGLHRALEEAVFIRHHFPHYQIDVARKERQKPSELTRFVEWLESYESAAYHHWLVGSLAPDSFEVQVQVARSRVGDYFPTHEDTDHEGLAVVYNLSRDWRPEHGGVLQYADPATGRALLAIVPRFNSVFLFRPRSAPHGVSEILAAAGDRSRYTITAFYLHSE